MKFSVCAERERKMMKRLFLAFSLILIIVPSAQAVCGEWVLVSSTGGTPCNSCSVTSGGTKTQYCWTYCCAASKDGSDCIALAIREHGAIVGVGVPPCFTPPYSDCCPFGPCSCNCTMTYIIINISVFEWRPSPEICDLIDNDCDGQTDEGFDVGASCTVGVGACQRTGTKVCSVDHTTTLCSATPGTPLPEICDGIDNDCNGVIDDLPPQTCYTGPTETLGKGICKAGNQTCTNGQWSACSGEVTPQTELCGDDIDSNCDGDNDKNCEKPESDLGNPGGAPCP